MFVPVSETMFAVFPLPLCKQVRTLFDDCSDGLYMWMHYLASCIHYLMSPQMQDLSVDFVHTFSCHEGQKMTDKTCACKWCEQKPQILQHQCDGVAFPHQISLSYASHVKVLPLKMLPSLLNKLKSATYLLGSTDCVTFSLVWFCAKLMPSLTQDVLTLS